MSKVVLKKLTTLCMIAVITLGLIISVGARQTFAESAEGNEAEQTKWNLTEEFLPGVSDSRWFPFANGTVKTGDNPYTLLTKWNASTQSWPATEAGYNGEIYVFGENQTDKYRQAGVQIRLGGTQVYQGLGFDTPSAGIYKITASFAWSRHTATGLQDDDSGNKLPSPTVCVGNASNGAYKYSFVKSFTKPELVNTDNDGFRIIEVYSMANRGDDLFFMMNAPNGAWGEYRVRMEVEKVNSMPSAALNMGQNYRISNVATALKGEMVSGDSADNMSSQGVELVKDATGNNAAAFEIKESEQTIAKLTGSEISAKSKVAGFMFRSDATRDIKFKYTLPQSNKKVLTSAVKVGLIHKDSDGEVVFDDIINQSLDQLQELTEDVVVEKSLTFRKGDTLSFYLDRSGDNASDDVLQYSFEFKNTGDFIEEITPLAYPQDITKDVFVGQKIQLSKPIASGVNLGKVRFSSSDTEIATISQSGEVTFLAEGNAVISAYIDDNENVSTSLEFEVTKLDVDYTVSIEVPDTLINNQLRATKKVQLSAKVSDDTVTLPITWATSDSSIASINTETGLVTGLKEGMVMITVTCGVATDSIALTIKPEITIKISGSTRIDFDDNTPSPKYSATITGTTDKATWSSSNESIATISADGEVTPIKTGYVVFTASVEDFQNHIGVKVIRIYEDKGTTWSFNDHFPLTQGENGFSVLYGKKTDKKADYSHLSTNGVVRSLDVPQSEPQQWKGPATDQYTTIGQNFFLPGENHIGIMFNAPVAGEYRTRLTFYWGASNANASFDGIKVGYVIMPVEGDGRIVWELDCTSEFLQNILTKEILVEQTITLAEGERLLFFVDAKTNGGWDDYRGFSYTLTNEDYDGGTEVYDPAPKFEKASLMHILGTKTDKSIGVDLKEKAVESLKFGDTVINTANYSISEGKLTFKASYLNTLEAGNHTFTLTTEGGASDIRVIVTGSIDPGDDDNNGEDNNGDDGDITTPPERKRGGAGRIILFVSLGVVGLSGITVGTILLIKKRKH